MDIQKLSKSEIIDLIPKYRDLAIIPKPTEIDKSLTQGSFAWIYVTDELKERVYECVIKKISEENNHRQITLQALETRLKELL